LWHLAGMAGTVSPRNHTHQGETREPVLLRLAVAEASEKVLPQRTSSLLDAPTRLPVGRTTSTCACTCQGCRVLNGQKTCPFR